MLYMMLLIIVYVPPQTTTEYSSRIMALGFNLAYLVPDYETDLFNNPQLLGTKVSGISYNPNEGALWRLAYLSSGFGVYARYWPLYFATFDSTSNEWGRDRHIRLSVRDLWMVKIGSYIVNLSNDGYFDVDEGESHDTQYSMNFAADYYVRSQVAFNLGENYYLDIKAGVGFNAWIQKRGTSLAWSPRVISPTGCIGVYKKDITTSNDFRTYFLSVGGPVARCDESLLPGFTTLDFDTSALEIKLFYDAVITKIGIGRGMPIAEGSCFIIGLRNSFAFQRSGEIQSPRIHQGFKNICTLPVAIEYAIGKVIIRFGTHIDYTFRRYCVFSDGSELLKRDKHDFEYSYSFGLGWTINEHFLVDFYNLRKLYELQEWSVSLQYYP